MVSTFPGTILAVGMALAVISAGSASFFLKLDSNQDKLVSPEVPFHNRYLGHLENFGDQEYLYVVIETGGTAEGKEKVKLFADDVARRLREHPDLIRAIYYRLTPRDLGDHVLLYASDEEAKGISDIVASLAPSINIWTKDANLAALLGMSAELLSGKGISPVDVDPAFMGRALDQMALLLKDTQQTLAGKHSHEFNLNVTGGEDHYFFTSNGKLLIMRILPHKNFATMDVIGKPLKAVRQAIAAAQSEFPGVRAGLTGRPVLQADEMQTTNRDMTRATIIAIILVGILFVAVLNGVVRPVLIVLSLLLAIAWTFGFALVAVGYLNLLSIVFVLVLVGIGVDFGVHIMMRYVEASLGGLNALESVATSLAKSGPGVVMSALTSVCAFYAVLGSDFVGLSELGEIGGTGVLLSLLAMLTVLPAMILIINKKHIFTVSHPRLLRLTFLEKPTHRPGMLLLILGVISLAALPGLFKLHFSYDLLSLQAKGLESVEYEKVLIDDSNESTWYAIFTAGTLGEVKQLTQTLEATPGVGKVESIMDFIPEDQRRKSTLYEKAAKSLDVIPASAGTDQNVDPNALIVSLDQLQNALEGLEEKLFASGAGKELNLIGQCIDSVQKSIEILKKNPSSAQRLVDLQTRLDKDLLQSLRQLRQWMTTGPVTPENLPESIRATFVGKDGRYQIKVSPNTDVWKFDELNRFVSNLRAVDPNVSGVPVGVLESARLMHRTFLSAALLTLVLVSVLLWLSSRSFVSVMLMLLPLAVSMLWLLEIMGLFGLNFNLANFFAIPILIAIGVDGGVHFLARWKELEGRGGLFSTSTPTAVSLSFTTTMIGFGGLLLAHHRGLASLGAVMVLGSLTGVIACLLVLPAVLNLMKKYPEK